MKQNTQEKRPKVILTCFAGRRRNMELLLLYADRLHAMGLIDEMHIWDFSRNKEDGRWLERTFQRAPLLSTPKYDYFGTNILLSAGEVARIAVRCNKDAHILLTGSNGGDAAEICLGAYDNSLSLLRGNKQGETICSKGGPVCDGREWRIVEFSVGQDGYASVSVDGESLLSGRLGGRISFPLKVHLAGWEGFDEVKWVVPDKPEKGRMHPYARLFCVRNKSSWNEYYRHYTTSLYPNHIIMKSDDDIVFIDVESFGRFTEQREQDKDSLLLLPNIVNNGNCAGHQQKRGYLDNSLGAFDPDNVMGRLWGDGKLCGQLHCHFVKNHESWVERSRGPNDCVSVPKGTRVSINFFAIRSEDLFAYQIVTQDDERDMTVDATRVLNRSNKISMNMTVAHLAFYKQRETGLDERGALTLYRGLANKILGRVPIRYL